MSAVWNRRHPLYPMRVLGGIERVARKRIAEGIDVLGPCQHRHAICEQPQDARDDCHGGEGADGQARDFQIHRTGLAAKG